jgi:hypothetical protein
MLVSYLLPPYERDFSMRGVATSGSRSKVHVIASATAADGAR